MLLQPHKLCSTFSNLFGLKGLQGICWKKISKGVWFFLRFLIPHKKFLKISFLQKKIIEIKQNRHAGATHLFLLISSFFSLSTKPQTPPASPTMLCGSHASCNRIPVEGGFSQEGWFYFISIIYYSKQKRSKEFCRIIITENQ